MNITEFKDKFYSYTYERKYKEALSLVDNALAERLPPDQLITKGILDILKKFQSYFDEGYINISAFQLLAVGKIAEDSLEKIKPWLIKDNQTENIKDKIVLGTIKNDFHGLGKKILKLFLEMENFEVIDLGLDVEPAKFVDAAQEHDAKYIFVSTMMLHNIIGVKRVGDILFQRNLRDKVKFFVGGAPFNYNYGLIEKVGADGSAEDVYLLMDKIIGRVSKRKKRFKILRRYFKRGM